MNQSRIGSVSSGVQLIDLQTPQPAPIDPEPTPPARSRPSLRQFLTRPRVSLALTVLAGVLVFAALVFPNVLYRLGPLGFVRIPLEGAFLRSATIVNTMIKQLGVFTSEVTRVAREVGTEGKLRAGCSPSCPASCSACLSSRNAWTWASSRN